MQVTYVTSDKAQEKRIRDNADPAAPPPKFFTFVEANRWQKMRLLRQLLGLIWIFVRTRPDVVITTGAAPGYFAIRLGKLFGAKTVWLDSMANAEELSLSGQKVGKHADLWLTQWDHLAEPDGPQCLGSVL